MARKLTRRKLVVLYAFYLIFTGAAILREAGPAWATGHRAEWRITAFLMLTLPIATASLITILFAHDEVLRWLFGGFLSVGVLVLAVGFALRNSMRKQRALALRVVGWSLIASALLVPAATVLFAPAAGLLAFLVPRRYPRAHRDSASLGTLDSSCG